MATTFRSGCPIASALDIVGDRWTLLVLRSMAMGATSFADLAALPEKIASNILADRLRRLEAEGLIVRAPAARAGRRGGYRLTEAGADLLPVLQALARWGAAHLPERWPVPERFLTARPADLRG